MYLLYMVQTQRWAPDHYSSTLGYSSSTQSQPSTPSHWRRFHWSRRWGSGSPPHSSDRPYRWPPWRPWSLRDSNTQAGIYPLPSVVLKWLHQRVANTINIRDTCKSKFLSYIDSTNSFRKFYNYNFFSKEHYVFIYKLLLKIVTSRRPCLRCSCIPYLSHYRSTLQYSSDTDSRLVAQGWGCNYPPGRG